jgi:hypothetical protein
MLTLYNGVSGWRRNGSIQECLYAVCALYSTVKHCAGKEQPATALRNDVPCAVFT